MDRQAVRFIEMLNDDSRDDNGNDKIDIQLKMKLFQMGQDWLIRRQKLRPSDDGGAGSGVKDMMAWINDPQSRAALADAMYDAGFVKTPERNRGRPTKAQAEVRARYKEATGKTPAPATDDSAWRNMLKDDPKEKLNDPPH